MLRITRIGFFPLEKIISVASAELADSAIQKLGLQKSLIKRKLIVTK